MTRAQSGVTSAPSSLLVLATGNRHKAQELRHLLTSLAVPLRSLVDFPDVRAVAENGSTLAENAQQKAVGYARQLGQWVLADDTGLEVDALAGAPGVLSSRYAGEQATMSQNRAKLLEQLRDVPPPLRTARFVCCLAVANPAGEIIAEAAGHCPGIILQRETTGPYGFGYDVLFRVTGTSQTLAELSPEQTAVVGHRGRAVRSLLEHWHGVDRRRFT
jgi:XTP/dITP diphosphohydrolase